MMTAAITGSEPLATLLCNSAERSLVNGLRETARRCRDSGLHVRMYVFDDLADQREALLTPARAIIWDGHSSWDDDDRESTDHRWKACSATMAGTSRRKP